jgi:Tfp pilus assembly protein PilN
MPEDVWLLSLDASGQSATAPATTPSTPTTSGTPSSVATTSGSTVQAATSFTITGYTYTQPSVARLMRRLALVPWLQNVSLTTSSKTMLSNHPIYQFTLGANVITLPEVGP